VGETGPPGEILLFQKRVARAPQFIFTSARHVFPFLRGLGIERGVHTQVPSEPAEARSAGLPGGIARGICGSRRSGETAPDPSVPSVVCESPLGIVCFEIHSGGSMKISRISLFARGAIALVAALVVAAPLFAQANSPWENAVTVLQTAFTSTIARGLSLVAIVVSGLTFAFGEGGSKRVLAGVLFGVGMAIAAVNFLAWLFPG
jgi:type IV secretory pathway VirB2 component (pilin)